MMFVNVPMLFSHLHLRSGLANRAERRWLLAGLRWHIVKDHSEGTLRWECVVIIFCLVLKMFYQFC